MQTQIFPQQRTVMRFASWLGTDIREERVLPYLRGHYEVVPGAGAERWTVVLVKTGEIVYNGIGPVEILAVDQPAS